MKNIFGIFNREYGMLRWIRYGRIGWLGVLLIPLQFAVLLTIFALILLFFGIGKAISWLVPR